MNAYGDYFKQESAEVNEALLHMGHGYMRDNTGDCNKVKTKPWKSPTTGKEREFELYVAHTYFTLKDEDNIENKAEETLFIEKTCNEIGDALVQIMKSEAFAECYKCAIGNERIWNAITKEFIGYVPFVNRAKVKVQLCSNFNTHLTKTDAAELSAILYEHSGKEAKCPVAQTPPDNANDEENEKEDSPDDQQGGPERDGSEDDEDKEWVVEIDDCVDVDLMSRKKKLVGVQAQCTKCRTCDCFELKK